MAVDNKVRKLQFKDNEVKNTAVTTCFKVTTEIQNGCLKVQAVEAKTQTHRKTEKLPILNLVVEESTKYRKSTALQQQHIRIPPYAEKISLPETLYADEAASAYSSTPMSLATAYPPEERATTFAVGLVSRRGSASFACSSDSRHLGGEVLLVAVQKQRQLHVFTPLSVHH